ncbi:MAG: GNAT family N-acetyltransferase, partial [Thermoleophilia bacterium]|nr:GNAT family N-acetyltransferase [Thermoleophilia bacterium]
DRGGVRLLFRHDDAVDHPALSPHPGTRMNMRRPLQPDVAAFDASIGSSRRNQVKKARKLGMTVEWGAEDLLPDFYRIFAENMRDLGSPAYGVGLFREALRRFPGRAELAVVRLDGRAVAAGFLAHGWGVTEVPSASSLRAYNSTNANLLMYWHLMERAVLRGQAVFDFGRSAAGDSVYVYKERWGARPSPAGWQVAGAGAGGPGPNTQGGGRRLVSRVWKRLPLPLANRLGPAIVRGLP